MRFSTAVMLAPVIAIAWYQGSFIRSKCGMLYVWASAELGEHISMASAFVFLTIFWILSTSILTAGWQVLFVTYRFHFLQDGPGYLDNMLQEDDPFCWLCSWMNIEVVDETAKLIASPETHESVSAPRNRLLLTDSSAITECESEQLHIPLNVELPQNSVLSVQMSIDKDGQMTVHQDGTTEVKGSLWFWATETLWLRTCDTQKFKRRIGRTVVDVNHFTSLDVICSRWSRHSAPEQIKSLLKASKDHFSKTESKTLTQFELGPEGGGRGKGFGSPFGSPFGDPFGGGFGGGRGKGGQTSRPWAQTRPAVKKVQLESFMLPAEIVGEKDYLETIEDARQFLDQREWYNRRGIPWRRGYLLH
jgi:hypothetical protein